MMKWVKFNERKPSTTGYYYIKGKSGYGAWEWFSAEDGFFNFDYNTPLNKVAFEYLEWLDENPTNYENPQDAQD